MKDTLTAKQEKFTLNLFSGMTQREAYLKAGYAENKPAVVDINAHRLAQNTKVLLRLQTLKDKAASNKIASVIERKEILTEILRGRLSDFIHCGQDGSYVNVGPESLNNAAIQEITSHTEYDKEGNSPTIITRIKLHDPVKAIQELNKMEGAYAPERHELTGKDGKPIEIDARELLISRINLIVERKQADSATPELKQG